jgi:hypothetical protein
MARFASALAAVLLGNAVYFLLAPYLPPPARHVAFKMDFGLLLDFVFCLAALWLIRTMFRTGRQSGSSRT